ncbi:MAG: hypothetical protein Q4D80_02230 [Pseudomonadota bacterium]|nr:hypothetical protein [Pseudomonadota bacterium]
MFKNKILLKTAGWLSLASFCAAAVPFSAQAYRLTPLSFSKMYGLAQNGEVEALRASVRRGMNIDTVNQNGDTGLCIAAQRKDAYTYNVFRAAGANPRHPCVQRIEHYDDFVNSSKAVSVTATPREAYGTIGKEEYKISAATWWILGGLAVGGGIAAIALGGGGGGGSSHNNNNNNNESDSYDYIGKYLSENNSVAKLAQAVNLINNDGLLTILNTDTKKIAEIIFNKDVQETGKYLATGLKATDNGSYTNATNSKIQVGAGGTAMAAVGQGNVMNNGYINVDSFNASVGMIASNHSTANNNGTGVVENSSTNGIDLNFSGYSNDNMIIGMYADSNSTIYNNGDIQGTAIKASTAPTDNTENNNNSGNNDSFLDDILPSAEGVADGNSSSSTSVSGTLIGMETMILNTGAVAVNEKSQAYNYGKIKLSAGDAGLSNSEIKVSIIGMGSYLDDGFMNSSKNIQRADKAYLSNKGTIQLSYTGNYTFDTTKTLRKGLGGIIGMRADANTTAENDGTIDIILPDSNPSSSSSSSSVNPAANADVAVAAGMQSVHTGIIKNNKDGKILLESNAYNSRVSYGMLAVEGSGTVSGLYTAIKPNIVNDGTIQLRISNGYGIASYNGGTITNNGTITLGDKNSTTYKNNIGLYGSGDSTFTTLVNNGEINIYSYESKAIQNDFSGDVTIQNDGIIHIYSNAVDSDVFAGNYSKIVNNGTVIYETTSNNAGSVDNTGSSGNSGNSGETSETYNPDNFNLDITRNIITTKSANSSSSTTERIENYGTVKLVTAKAAAMSVETAQGTAFNGGTITLASNKELGAGYTGNNYVNAGMLLGEDTLITSSIINAGTINVESDYSVGMASQSKNPASVTNEETGVINVKGKNSFGLYAKGNSQLYNKGIINLYGENNVGLYSSAENSEQNGTVIQNNIIKIYGKNAIAYQISGNASIDNPGQIIVCSSDEEGCNPDAAKTMTAYSVSGKLVLNTQQNISGGTMVKTTSEDSDVMIGSSGRLTLYDSGTLIDASAGGTITNNGDLIVSATGGTAILGGEDNTITNNKNINLYAGSENTGITVKGGTTTNAGTIDITESSTKSTGIDVSGGEVENSGTINVYSTESTGIKISDGEVENKGTINISGGYNIGVDVSGGSFTNSKDIDIRETTAATQGIYVHNGATAENKGNIYIQTITSSHQTRAVLLDNGTFKNSGTISGGLIYIYNTESGHSEFINSSKINDVEIYINNGGIFTNEENGTISINHYSEGIYVTGINSKITNSGTIELLSANVSAVSVKEGATFTNNEKVIVDGTTSSGIYITDVNSTATNSGNISVEGNDSIGVSVKNAATFTNDGDIYINGSRTKGISLSDSNSSTTSSGTITVDGDNSYGVYFSDAKSFKNDGTITVNGNNSNGIYASGSSSEVTSNTLTVNGDKSTGVSISGGVIFTNSGDITVKGDEPKGIYSLNSSITNSGKITVESNGYSADAIGIDLQNGTLKNEGTITVKDLGAKGLSVKGPNVEATNSGTIAVEGDSSFGIYSDSGSSTITSSGTITVNGNKSTGVSISNGSFTNTEGTITVKGNNTTGISISGASTVVSNSGAITVDGVGAIGVNISAGKFVNTENGSITVTGDEGKGINISGGDVRNSGSISVSGIKNSKGVYISGGKFTNLGTISIKGDKNSYGIDKNGGEVDIGSEDGGKNITADDPAQKCNGLSCPDKKESAKAAAFKVVGPKSAFINNGTFTAETELDFDAITNSSGTMAVGKNGSYSAEGFKGVVAADASITQSGFETVYTNENSFVGKDNGLDITSGSYLFSADKQLNDNGNIDVVMTMKSFDDTIARKEMAAYLAQNYTAQKGEGVFNILKSMSDADSLNAAVNREFGFSMLPNLAKQDLDVLANVNRAANNDILSKTDKISRSQVNVLSYQQEMDNKQHVSGYKDKVTGVYGFSDYQIAADWRAGFGAAAVRTDSDFDDGSSRYNNMLQIFAPISYVRDNFRAMIKFKTGFGKGHYRRQGTENAYKADLTNYYYGADIEARQTVETTAADVEPVIGFNLTGVSMDDIKENNNGLHAGSDNLVSAQSVIGLDIKKKLDLAKDQSVVLTAGGRYYHEFGNKYKTSASLDNMVGSYELVSNRLQRNSGLLNLKAQYDYKDVSVSAAVYKPVEQKSNIYYLFNLGYVF